ncbi:MAG TPA: hypothetical protein VEV87_03135 [Chitinophagaceae bacterium]|nr:hypothetical protein [Chitinophagaceae bacterium]
MEQKLLKIILIQLKLVALGCVAMMIFVISTAFRSEDGSDNPFKEIGISKERGEEFITESFLKGYFYSLSSVNPKNIVAGNKAAVTKDLLVYCKRHLRTESFKQEYREFRTKAKPLAPIIRTKEQIRIELVSNYEETIRNNQNMVNYALVMKNPEMKIRAEKSMAKCRKIIEEVNAGSSKLMTEQLIYADMRYEADLRTFQKHICEWEKNYPADTRQLIKSRLELFLDITKDIDFNAGLKEVNGKKIFVNPFYEQKSAEWKMGYRAGKDVVQTARTFAGEWMKEL